jgi:hypothetical protein
MNPSIKQAAERKAALEAEAKKVWNDLAEALAARIPESCRKFASEKGWYKSDIDGWWSLPKFLEDLVDNTNLGGGSFTKYDAKDIETYGFVSFDDFESKLKELEQAWVGLVRIDMRRVEKHHIEIGYYTTEFESDTSAM